MGGEEAAIVQTMHDYVAAFSRHDAKATAEYWQDPSVALGDQGPQLRTRAEVEAGLERLLGNLKSQGFGKTRYVEAHARQVNDRFALVSTLTVRYLANGAELARLGTLYTLCKTPSGWKILMASGHKPEDVMRLDQLP